jgi:hypothetical protein
MTKEIKTLVSNFLNINSNWQIHLISNWDIIIGKLKDNATLEKIDRDTLIISVTNSSWLQELYLLSNILIKKINNKLPYPYVKRLRFKLCEKKTFKTRKKIENKIITLKNTKLTKREEIALEKITDQELSLELKKFLIKCKEINR